MLQLNSFTSVTDELFFINGGSGSSSSSGSSGSSSGRGSSGHSSHGITATSISVGHVAPATTTTSKGIATGQRA